MYWLIAYFTIGWLLLLVGVWQSRPVGLPVGVALVLFFMWPWVLPKGLWLAQRNIRRNRWKRKT